MGRGDGAAGNGSGGRLVRVAAGGPAVAGARHPRIRTPPHAAMRVRATRVTRAWRRPGVSREDGAAHRELQDGRLAHVADGGNGIRTDPHTATRVRARCRQKCIGSGLGLLATGCGRAGSPAWLPAGVQSAHPKTRARGRGCGSAKSPSRPRGDGPPAGVDGLPGAGQPVGRGRCGGGHSGCRQWTRMGIECQEVALPAAVRGLVGPLRAASVTQVRGIERRQFESWQVTSPKGQLRLRKGWVVRPELGRG